MSGLLFVSQAMLETWAEQGKIDFTGNLLSVVAGSGKGRSYALEPAVRFLKVVGGDQDPHSLVHKVKSDGQLKAIGAETVGDSCIVGDTAYEVQPGFLAEGAALQAAAAARPAAPARPPTARPAAPPPPGAPSPAPAAARPAPMPAAPAATWPPRPLGPPPLPRDLEERRKEAEALARFLLEKLS